MWLIIIGLIIGVIIYNFLKDDEKQKKKIESQGGMTTKYASLIDTLSFAKHSIVKNSNRDNVTLVVNSDTDFNTFTIMQVWKKVHVKWHGNSLLGSFDYTWEFDEHVDQEDMGMKVMKEMMIVIGNNASFDKVEELFATHEPHEVIQQKPIIQETKKEKLFDDSTIRCSICNDTGKLYSCGHCSGDISFSYYDGDVYEFCENCSGRDDEELGGGVSIYEEPCPCKEYGVSSF